jgi:hypothetical protein
MNSLDQTLENIVRDWLASNATGRADMTVRPATRGGPPAFEVQPRNTAALPITVWVADDGAHVAFSIGGGSWWPDHVALEKESVREVLSAVFAAQAGEEVRRVRGRIVARRGYVELGPGRQLTYREMGLFAVLPGFKWESIVYQAY